MEIPIEFVSRRELREMFNVGRYLDRAKKNQLHVFVEQYAHRAPADLPYCTSSVILEYRDRKQNTVAYVHQYRLPMGPDQRPDPKMIIVDGVAYRELLSGD